MGNMDFFFSSSLIVTFDKLIALFPKEFRKVIQCNEIWIYVRMNELDNQVKKN